MFKREHVIAGHLASGFSQWGWAAVGVALCAFGLGCSSAADPEEEAARRWLPEVEVIEPWQIGDRDFDVLADLDERRRIGQLGEQDAIDEAKRALRLRAAKVDADALVIVQCERLVDPNDLSTKATPTVICQGAAIRWVSYGSP